MQSSSTQFARDAEQGSAAFIDRLRAIVGRRHVLTSESATRRFRTGYRFGSGRALAVVRPGSLREQWRVTRACVDADKIVIMQAANTGLTGGSTPRGNDYDRDVVIVSTLRMRKLHIIRGGSEVVCLPGATLDQLEQALEPLGREPHSVIGSSCIGASVFGGVCNNSGGALVQRGPAFTHMALFAQLGAAGDLQLVNHLGIRLNGSPEEMLDQLEQGRFTETDIASDAGWGHDRDYIRHVREIDAATPARFNADPKRLYEASGCAGKLIVFAVRLDTFPRQQGVREFYVGTNDAGELASLRRGILAEFDELPIAAEYLHRGAFDVAEQYGKDTFLLITRLGTRRLPGLFAFKSWLDGWLTRVPFLRPALTDRLMQRLAQHAGPHLPARLREYRDLYEHHLMLKVSGTAVAQTRALLDRMFPSTQGNYFQCTPEEGRSAFLHRFVAAGAAIRYRAIHAAEVEEIVALDVALRRNESDWFEKLPLEMGRQIVLSLYYGHFLCHVFHQDYIVRKGCDPVGLEHAMWKLLDDRGAEYPAEHNVGHLYRAKPALRDFYRKLDPCNAFNPGIGATSKRRNGS